jgi:hypothetical protein
MPCLQVNSLHKESTAGTSPRLSSVDECSRWDRVCRSEPSSLVDFESFDLTGYGVDRELAGYLFCADWGG